MIKHNLWHPSFYLQIFPNLYSHSSFPLVILFECFPCSSLFGFFVRISLTLLADLTKIILIIPSYTYSISFVWLSAVTLPAINIAPTLSTLTSSGGLTKMFMLCNSWITSILLSQSPKVLPILPLSWTESCSTVICIVKTLVHMKHKVENHLYYVMSWGHLHNSCF